MCQKYSNGQVHVVWNLRSSGGGDPGTTGLTVMPLQADVPEGGSLSFRVEVLPTKGNCYFAEEAEAFVSPSNQMTFRYSSNLSIVMRKETRLNLNNVLFILVCVWVGVYACYICHPWAAFCSGARE